MACRAATRNPLVALIANLAGQLRAGAGLLTKYGMSVKAAAPGSADHVLCPQRAAFVPHALDQNQLGANRRASFVAVNLLDQQIHGGGADLGVVLEKPLISVSSTVNRRRKHRVSNGRRLIIVHVAW